MKRFALLATLLFVAHPAFAGEKVKGSNFLVVDQQTWPTSEASGYWMYRGEGVHQTLGDPSEAGPVECVGSGYWDKEGSWGEGICIYGADDDTRVTSWKLGKGQEEGEWKILSGTGEYAGMTGQGTYVATSLQGGRVISEWQGEITPAE